VERESKRASQRVLELRKSQILEGQKLSEFAEESETTATAARARSAEKERAILLLTEIFCALMEKVGGSRKAIYDAYRALALGIRISTPHSLQHALF